MEPQVMILYQSNCSAKHYLQALFQIYPYDIEEEMLYSLLKPDPYPYPALLAFIDYARHIRKYHIVIKQESKLQLDALYTTMCKLSQRNQMVLYTHQFQINASLHAKTYSFHNPYAHLPLNDISFIDDIHLHIPASIDMDTLKPQTIVQATHFIYRNLSLNANDYLALSIQIADCHGLVFLPKKYVSLLCACAALYQIGSPSLHNDFFLLYGISSQSNASQIYYDASNELTLGLHMGDGNSNHFQYLKDMISTLYSCHCLKKNDYPLHGSMLQIHFPQKSVGILMIGSQGTGKSALCDCFVRLCEEEHIRYTKVFDDQGVLHNLDNDLYASGSEIGAYIHVDDLPQATTLKNLSATLLMQEQKLTTHMILPFTSFDEVAKFHKVDILYYLDNTIKTIDKQFLSNLQETCDLLELGKHRRKNRTIETSPFWGSFAHTFDEKTSHDLLYKFLTLMYMNTIEIFMLSTYHSNKPHTQFFDKKARQLYEDIRLSIYEKEDCEKM